MTLKILFLSNDLGHFLLHRFDHYQRLRHAGHDLAVASGRAHDPVKRAQFSDDELIQLEVVHQRFSPLADTALVRRFMKIIRDRQPDCIHAITIKPIFCLAWAILLMPRSTLKERGFVFTFSGLGKVFEDGPGIGHLLRRKLVSFTLTLAARRAKIRAIVENPDDKQRLLQFRVFPDDTIEIVSGTGIDSDLFRPARKQGELKVLFAGRLIKAKGIGEFLGAARKFSSERAPVKFFVAGLPDPTNPDAFDKALLECAIEAGHIEYFENLPRAEFARLLSQIDVMCLPTRLREGFPVSLLEAAASGCALIATDQPACRTIVKPEETGWLLDPPSPEAIVNSLEQAVADLEQTRQMGKNARALIETLPVSTAQISDCQLSIYRALTQ